MRRIPPEIMCYIMSFLKPRDLITCTKVSRFWGKCARDDESWKKLLPNIKYSRYKNYRKVMRYWYGYTYASNLRYVPREILIMSADIVPIDGEIILKGLYDEVKFYYIGKNCLTRFNLINGMNKFYKLPENLVLAIVKKVERDAKEVYCSFCWFEKKRTPIDKTLGTCPEHYDKHMNYNGKKNTCYGHRCKFCSKSSFY